MEIKILEEKKNKLLVDITDSPQAALEILKKELWQTEHVKLVGTNVGHPLLNKQTLILETDGQDPHKVIGAAAKKLQKILAGASESLKSVR